MMKLSICQRKTPKGGYGCSSHIIFAAFFTALNLYWRWLWLMALKC